MKSVPIYINDLDICSAHELAELWVQLSEAALTDAEAQAFLVMFEPWARARLGSVS